MTRRKLFVVVPSLKITGGTKEIVRLARDAAAAGDGDVRIVSMWRTPEPVDAAPLEVVYLHQGHIGARTIIASLPLVIARCRALAGDHPAGHWTLGHYMTYVFAPFVAANRLWYFVQDLEWHFVPPRFRTVLRRFILTALRRGRVLAANRYLAAELRTLRVPVVATIPIWASPVFLGRTDGHRDLDIAIVVRRGAHKRVDLVRRFLALHRAEYPSLRLAIVTPNDEFADEFAGHPNAQLHLRPTPAAMRALYERTKLILLLSEHEGFGLPPLEAMGSGCVPLCRDAGGVRAYMVGPLAENVVPLSLGVDQIMQRAADLIADAPRLDRLRQSAREIFEAGLADVARRPSDLAACGII